MIRVLIVDDQPLFREGLAVLLNKEPDIEVCGQASDGDEAAEAVLRLRPDVTLMDLKMQRVGGVQATREVLRCAAEARIVILTTYDEDRLVYDALAEGAVGYLLKESSSQEIAEALRKAVQGHTALNPAVARKVVDEFARMARQLPGRHAEEARGEAKLTARELEVLRLVSRGASNKDIAQALFVAEGTVKNHLSHIFRKIGVTDRLQAAIYARDLGL